MGAERGGVTVWGTEVSVKDVRIGFIIKIHIRGGKKKRIKIVDFTTEW